MARRGRKAMGMGTMLLLGGAAWWLYTRNRYPSHIQAAQIPTDLPLESYSAERKLTAEEVAYLVRKGELPSDAVHAWVHADVPENGWQRPAMPGLVGMYLVGTGLGQLAAMMLAPQPSGSVSGYGSVLYPTDVYATPLAAGGGPSITPGLWF